MAKIRDTRGNPWSIVAPTLVAVALLLGGCDNFFSSFVASCKYGDEYGGGSGYGGGPGADGGIYGYDSPYYDPYVATPDPSALLWSSRGGSRLFDFCKDKSDDTPLPPDPRTLVQPGVDDGRAVLFNMQWRDCHADPEAVGEAGHPETCGELRTRAARGDLLMRPSTPGGGSLFSGNVPWTLPSGFGVATLPARAYNDLWKVWGGFDERPDNFDELVAQRYGLGFGPTPNPYPLPGEDPNLTNGGSGQLPDFFTHLRTPQGTWTGQIGITCHGCHNGEAGRPEDGPGLGRLVGSGSNVVDYNLFLRDMLPLGYPASIAVIANLNRTRGTNNASDVNLAFIFPDEQLLPGDLLLGLLTSGSTAGMDTPAWWNMGHRPVKFIDGIFPMDAPRVDMVFYTPFAGIFGTAGGPISEAGQDWMRQHGTDLNEWVQTLKSPPFPFDIDVPLAEEGAVLFHELNLWAAGRANPVRRPEGGNGSCASCHGAYAPRYFNDPAFLAYPELEGMAGYMTPLDIIGTDPVRLETNNEAMQVAGSINFFGYPPTKGTPNDCGPQNQERLLNGRELGYMAPPLFGVWASAPYFHNGSVPNLRAVLDPVERPAIWERWSAPARPDQEGVALMGFDTRLEAFDAENVGWGYDEHVCAFGDGIVPYLNCNPNNEDADPLAQRLLAGLYGNVIATWNLFYPPPLTRQMMENRKVYNTHMFAQGNEGHEFSRVLTDHEMDALLEYMKTL